MSTTNLEINEWLRHIYYCLIPNLFSSLIRCTRFKFVRNVFWIQTTPTEHPKCIRCWHHREDVGTHAEHPELCGRCVGNVDGEGEQRRYA